MGYYDVNIPEFFTGEKSQFFGFFADPHFRECIQRQNIGDNYHTPNTAVLVGRNAPRFPIDLLFYKFCIWDPQAQFFINLPGNPL